MVTDQLQWPERHLPRAYDVVWVAFPEREFPERPVPKPRPCLVDTVMEGDGEFLLIVYPGTTQLKTGTRQYDYFVTNHVEMSYAGIPKATRFDLDDPLPLPYTREYFPPYRAGGKDNPVMGALSVQAVKSLQELLGWRQHLFSQQPEEAGEAD